MYIDACFVLAINYSLTYYLWIHVPFSVTASSGAHNHSFIWLLLFASTRFWTRAHMSKGRECIHYAIATDEWMDFFVYFTSEYLLQVQERYTHNNRHVRILLSPPLPTEKEQPRPHSQTFPQPCLMAISISSSSPSPVSDYIHAPDFAVNIYCHHMAEV